MTNQPPPYPAFSFDTPVWVEETGSTNDLVKDLAARGMARPGTVVAARRQTRGKGRMGNAWLSVPDRDLTFSFLWGGRTEPADAGTLPMACALAVRDFLALPEIGVPSRCKWPNDVLAGQGKICGILAETQPARQGETALIVGIGVNLAASPDRSSGVMAAVSSVEDETGVRHAPKSVLPALLSRLSARIDSWSVSGFAAIRPDLTACLWGVGREAAVRTGKETVTGVIQGLGERGELLLRTHDGGSLAVASVAALDFPAGG